MFDTISPTYDLVNRVMTFGLDQRWRQRALREARVQATTTILDVACGTGDFLTLAQTRTQRCIGVDFSYGMLRERTTVAPVVQGSALELPFADASFDVITCGFAIRNFTDLQGVFSEFSRILKAGGTLAILEVATPSNAVVRWAHQRYFNELVPLIGGLVSRSKEAYRYLPQSVAYLPTPEQFHELLTTNYFDPPRVIQLGFGASQLLIAERDSDH
jgi:demethylmenaquinone methyltransferase/2-methoxy-6-polyprenyl-1,4-benzoquinol methylase